MLDDRLLNNYRLFAQLHQAMQSNMSFIELAAIFYEIASAVSWNIRLKVVAYFIQNARLEQINNLNWRERVSWSMKDYVIWLNRYNYHVISYIKKAQAMNLTIEAFAEFFWSLVNNFPNKKERHFVIALVLLKRILPYQRSLQDRYVEEFEIEPEMSDHLLSLTTKQACLIPDRNNIFLLKKTIAGQEILFCDERVPKMVSLFIKVGWLDGFAGPIDFAQALRSEINVNALATLILQNELHLMRYNSLPRDFVDAALNFREFGNITA